MKTKRYANSRQKACQHCFTAKAKCDRHPKRCGRCAQRDLDCTYPRDRARTPAASADSTRQSRDGIVINPVGSLVPLSGPPPGYLGHNTNREAQVTPGAPILAIAGPDDGTSPTVVSSELPATPTPLSAALAASNGQLSGPESISGRIDLELVCPIDPDSIESRWLSQYVPVPGQQVKNYPDHIKAFIPKILGSYASTAVRGRGVPPFIHPAQMQPPLARPPLSTCLSLVRICERLLPGSDITAMGVIQREMSSLYETHASMDDGITLLSAFQAYLLYLMVLFFRLGHLVGPSLRRAMMDLQGLASLCSRQGLVCVAEQKWARPRWESWIVAEAKRRTLYTMYLFDSVLATLEDLPTFFGTELQGLPAPAGKDLWEAKAQRDWETAYNTHLVDWAEGGLRIDELWPAPSWLDESGLGERRKRADKWLDEVDAFGTMLFAVSSSSHSS
ncbi:hypothetical protein INS49_009899 [Diaporthe citri]|uniref:uncharacterized protein n=1 Tax=Diaporthe citri TaxID=83186 RepID=UPI001C80FCB8|nr:uncharacterized protein INS49_009899 [Diaporthe citri]KAG6361672.1 hypothetical protein INS49_009899 [Diaporthe citri]